MKSKVAERLIKEVPKATKLFVDKYAMLTIRINHFLAEKGYSKSTLAEKLDKSPSEISKWLNGEHNFTLKSIAKLEAALGVDLLNVPMLVTKCKFKGQITSSLVSTYSHKEEQERVSNIWVKPIIKKENAAAA